MHLLPFLLRAQAVLRRHISAFLAGKSHPTLLRGWPGSTGYQIFAISSQSPPPSTLICHYLLLFVTIRDYSSLFATIRHYSHYSYYLNNRVFLSRNYRLIVAPWKFDVLKTNICPRSEASRANMLVLRTSNFQGATIRPIVPRHKHSVVFIVHY